MFPSERNRSYLSQLSKLNIAIVIMYFVNENNELILRTRKAALYVTVRLQVDPPYFATNRDYAIVFIC
jgi:hypothetical protein